MTPSELEKRCAELERIVGSLPDTYYRTDAAGVIVVCTAAVEEVLGWRLDQVIGKPMADLYVDPQERARVVQAVLAAKGGFALVEARLRRADGGVCWASTRARALYAEDGRFAGVEGASRDITDRVSAEEALRVAERRYRTLFETSPDAICVNRISDGMFLEASSEYLRIMGYRRDEVVGRTSVELDTWVDPADRERLVGAIRRDGVCRNLEVRVRKKNGDAVWALTSASLIEFDGFPCTLTMSMDVTERRALEAGLRESQKLEAIGLLAGGIAHDFNNLLVGILGNIDLVLSDPSSPVARECLVDAQQASLRAAELVKQMLAYAGRGRFVVEPVRLQDIIGDMAQILGASISRRAVLRFTHAPDTPAVVADAAQLRQVAMNLIINASESLGDQDGVIAVSTGVLDCDRAFLARTFSEEGLAEGRYTFLEVSDTGCGLDVATRPRIFDPFFTTKKAGRGLGLSAVLGIVRGHRGAVSVDSEPGRGTTFRVLLPASEAAPVVRATVSPVAAWRGSGHVLVVDDEEDVRRITRRILERLGFEVTTVNDGLEAVARLEGGPGDFRCAIVDLTMPRLDGVQTFHALRRIRPDLRVVMSSGFSEQELADRFSGTDVAAFLHKPFGTAAVAAAVRRALA